VPILANARGKSDGALPFIAVATSAIKDAVRAATTVSAWATPKDTTVKAKSRMSCFHVDFVL